jgi:hypothetical protein
MPIQIPRRTQQQISSRAARPLDIEQQVINLPKMDFIGLTSTYRQSFPEMAAETSGQLINAELDRRKKLKDLKDSLDAKKMAAEYSKYLEERNDEQVNNFMEGKYKTDKDFDVLYDQNEADNRRWKQQNRMSYGDDIYVRAEASLIDSEENSLQSFMKVKRDHILQENTSSFFQLLTNNTSDILSLDPTKPKSQQRIIQHRNETLDAIVEQTGIVLTKGEAGAYYKRYAKIFDVALFGNIIKSKQLHPVSDWGEPAYDYDLLLRELTRERIKEHKLIEIGPDGETRKRVMTKDIADALKTEWGANKVEQEAAQEIKKVALDNEEKANNAVLINNFTRHIEEGTIGTLIGFEPSVATTQEIQKKIKEYVSGIQGIKTEKKMELEKYVMGMYTYFNSAQAIEDRRTKDDLIYDGQIYAQVEEAYHEKKLKDINSKIRIKFPSKYTLKGQQYITYTEKDVTLLDLVKGKNITRDMFFKLTKRISGAARTPMSDEHYNLLTKTIDNMSDDKLLLPWFSEMEDLFGDDEDMMAIGQTFTSWRKRALINNVMNEVQIRLAKEPDKPTTLLMEEVILEYVQNYSPTKRQMKTAEQRYISSGGRDTSGFHEGAELNGKTPEQVEESLKRFKKGWEDR